MSERNIALYLDDIRTSIDKIETYTKGLSFDSFSNDPKTVDAVVRNLEIIGEAAKNIPKEIKVKYPEIPWKPIMGTRDKVIHEYFGIDLEILWKTLIDNFIHDLIYFLHMKTTVLKYNLLIKKEGKHFVSYIPTLGISDFGKTVDEAQKHIKEAIVCHIEGLLKTGDEVPACDTQEFYISQAEVAIPKAIKFAF